MELITFLVAFPHRLRHHRAHNTLLPITETPPQASQTPALGGAPLQLAPAPWGAAGPQAVLSDHHHRDGWQFHPRSGPAPS